MCELLNNLGTCKVAIEVLTILVYVGKSSGKQNVNSHVGICFILQNILLFLVLVTSVFRNHALGIFLKVDNTYLLPQN